jgi:hypothetical protein
MSFLHRPYHKLLFIYSIFDNAPYVRKEESYTINQTSGTMIWLSVDVESLIW